MRLVDAAREFCRRLTGAAGRAQAAAGQKLAEDLGLPANMVKGIMGRAHIELHKLSSADPNIDVRPIIDRAVQELSELGFHSRPFEEAIMDRYLQELPNRDYHILRYFKQGKKHSEIAELLGTDVESVMKSLVSTYAELRMRLINSHNGDDGGVPAAKAAHHGH